MCLSEIFTIEWWVQHNMVYLQRQGMRTIISSLVIQRYVKFFCSNWRRCHNNKIHVWLWVLQYEFVVIIMVGYLFQETQVSESKCPKHKVCWNGLSPIWDILTHWHATWASYLWNSIWYVYVKNVCISTIPTCIATLDMYITLLCSLPRYWSSKRGIRKS